MRGTDLQMTIKFDERKVAKGLTEFTIEFAKQAVFDPSRPMGNVAKSMMEFVVSSAFVGLFSEMQVLIPKFQAWLEDAIERRESFGEAPEYHLSQLHAALAISRWLVDGSIDRVSWKRSLEEERVAAAREKGVYSASSRKFSRLDQVMPAALLAGEPALAVSEYESAWGKSAVKKQSAMKPRKFAYAIALGSPQQEKADRFEWGKRVLRDSLDDWLSHGQFVTAAKWVCLVYSVLGARGDASDALRESVLDMSSPNTAVPTPV